MRRLAAVLVFWFAFGTPRLARADLASSFYDDIRDVVEELIQTEVTTSVVTTIQQRSPALAFYMHGTLERLGSPYWGSLGRALRNDLTVVVADFVYWHLSTGLGDGDIVTSAKQFFGCIAQVGKATASDGCKRLIAAVHDQHRPLLEVECRRAKPQASRRVACDIGLAVLAALEKRSSVRHHVLDALADVVLAEVDERGLGDRLRDVLTRWLDLPQNLPAELIEALGDPDLEDVLSNDQIDELCSAPETIDKFLHDLDSRAWICFAVTHSSLPAALGAHVTITDPAGNVDVHLDFWRIEAAIKTYDPEKATDDSAFRVLTDLAFEAKCPRGNTIATWPCKGPRLSANATLTVEWLGHTIAGTVDASGVISAKTNRQMMLWLLRFRKSIKRIEELRALVPPSLSQYLFFAGSPPSQSRVVLRSVARMARLVNELRARWYLWSQSFQSTADIDIKELLDVARDALAGAHRDVNEVAAAAGDVAGAAKQATVASLAFLDKTATGGASSIDIGDWLRMVMRDDYRSLAMEALRAALDLPLADSSRPRETFFLTLAAYLLDAGDGVGETVARSAFRAAAKDLLLSASHKGVPRAADRFRLRPLPRLSLRLAFNDTYAVTDGDTRRSVVAADWPTAMIAITDFVGIEGSLLDPVAPLAELALRPPGTYRDSKYVALDVLRPRFGVWLAVPQFSRRLSLSTGIGARFVHVGTEVGPTPLTARYSAKSSLIFDAGIQFVF